MFAPGSVTCPAPTVPLLVEHNPALRTGRAVHLTATPAGVYARLRLAARAGAAGRELPGLSPGVDVLDVRRVRGVLVVHRALLREVSLVRTPTFDRARARLIPRSDMPAPTGAHVMRNALVTIDSTEYANQCTKARLVPDTPVQTVRTLVPDGAVQDVDSSTWVLELSGLQIWGTGGLADALNDAAGTEISVTIQPKSGTGQDTATCTIIAMPVEFGGEQGSFRTFEAEFPVVGSPTFSTSA